MYTLCSLCELFKTWCFFLCSLYTSLHANQTKLGTHEFQQPLQSGEFDNPKERLLLREAKVSYR